MSKLAIIGGTGLTTLPGLEIIRREMVRTPFGEPSGPLTHGTLGDCEIVFIARHGYGHTIPPHKVNYRANIWSLKQTGVERVIAVAAVGGIRDDLKPTDIVIPDQIIDYTWSRGNTFFEDGDAGVTHIDFTYPYCNELRLELIEAAKKADIKTTNEATYAATQGPRLETAAEIDKLQRDGADIVGMTGMPEAALARELGLCYATCAVVANKAAGRSHGEITIEDIKQKLEEGMEKVRSILFGVVSLI
jgi:5'-deoxy-5'-methylthioadenosine phosphorylase